MEFHDTRRMLKFRSTSTAFIIPRGEKNDYLENSIEKGSRIIGFRLASKLLF